MKIRRLAAIMTLFIAQFSWAESQQHGNKYLVVWDFISNQTAFQQRIQEQAQVLLELWKQGLVENVYLNVGNRQSQKRDDAVVFFVKSKDEDEAHEILSRLPFIKHDVVSYKLYPVGILWLKQFGDQDSEGK